MVHRRLGMVLALTAAFLLVEVVGGYLSGSLALLADAGHMATDVGALALATIGARIAARRAHAAHRFGNLRWEVLAALVNGVVLFSIAVGISIEAVGRLREPHAIDAVLFGSVAAAGLVVNLISLRVLHGHHHHDLNVRGAYLHILGDVLGSVGAIAAAVVIQTTGWLPADPIISVLISLLILRSAWRLIRESGEILLDKVPPHVSVAEVEARLLAAAEVDRVHDVHVWTVTPGLVAMSAHVVAPELADHPGVLRQLTEAMGALGVDHVTIQLETGEPCEGEDCGEHAHPPVRGAATTPG
ncbi:MAG: cation transporter [Gemmatimonadetes bacterium]|nr:cation transporter [Gemmatimonadota bacterium]MCA9762014.1 cation transporter [Gemmatimonadota bacterium]MCA9767666.1 cation transporter [Gemmatimonadota bacterium]MCB9519090.1 cation transporter [Gemmatimonadales bacterium]HPF61157.1 cation diffusion facilitator family transporter [Gemmatimonadales bacterium]